MIINKEKVICEYEENKYIKYIEEDNIINYIDLVNDIYTRETSEFTFKIDFNNKKISYLLKEKNALFESDLNKCNIIKNNEIILNYKIDDEDKKIIIQIL